jgi:hypothetical protein
LTQDSFDKILLSAVNEGLCLLGDTPKQALLSHLEDPFQIEEKSIPSNLNEFRKALESIFGSGAVFLENAILKRLHETLGLAFEEDTNKDFLECVEMAKSLMLKRRK